MRSAKHPTFSFSSWNQFSATIRSPDTSVAPARWTIGEGSFRLIGHMGHTGSWNRAACSGPARQVP
jgi:hypothetical protein